VLSEEHLFSVFNELGVPLGLDGDLPPGCGGALGGAKPPAPYPARAARPAASWDEPGGGGASASDAQASSEPDLDDEDDSGEDSGPARPRAGGRGRARAAGRGRGRGRPDGRARGRGQVRPRPRDLEARPRPGWFPRDATARHPLRRRAMHCRHGIGQPRASGPTPCCS
jgi:hypothetical protein